MLNRAVFLIFIFLLSCSKGNDKKSISLIETHIKALQNKSSKSTLDSSFFYLKQADTLLKKYKFSDSLNAENNYLLGHYYKEKKDLDSAAIYLYKTIKYVKDSITSYRQDRYFIDACNNFWSIDKIGDSFTVIDQYFTLIDNENDHNRMALAYYFKSNAYLSLKDYNNALKFSKERIKMLKKANDSLNLILAYISLAKIKFHYLNDTVGTFKIMDSLVKLKNIQSNTLKKQIYGQYGVFKFFQEDYFTAINYYKKGIKSIKLSKNSPWKSNNLASSFGNIAEAYIELNKLKKAAIYLDSMASIGFNNIDDKYVRSYMKYKLSLATMTNKDISSITNYLDSIYNFQTHLYQKKINKELIALKAANTNEKQLLKEKQTIEINNVKLKLNLYLLLGFITLILILSFIFYQRRKFKYEKLSLQMQQRLLRSQMNPHFMFNTLSVIQNQIQKNPEKSSNYLIKFSRLLRLILDNSLHNYVLLENELESLEKYIELQLLRFPKKFIYSINFENLDLEDLIFIPPMLLQPFIENSIEHGFKGIDYLGEINIHLKLQNKFVKCIIEDNGVGFTKADYTYKNSTSLKLINSFLMKSTKSKMVIKNKKDQLNNLNGLYIEFLIPFKLSNND
ncbi:MAG: hypothetical protein COB12_04480 [Flavobacterium sp.]|nr:MAG: hypothetical protein COB12_04480 [Flavobacterium sp.]